MKKISVFTISFLFLFSLLGAEDTQYTNDSFARLSFVKGNTYIQRASDLGYEEGEVNMPISEGDRLGTTDGRAEIYLGKGNYIRLDNNTKIDFLNLPKRGYDLVRIHVWSGNTYFRVGQLEKEKNIEIHTTDASIYVLDEGLYRIDVRQNSETEIFVFNGMIETAGETGSVLIKDEQRLEVSNGRFLSRPTRFYAVAEDSFDRWSEHRDSQIRKRMAEAYLPEELEDFEYELASYGYWTYVAPYGNVWIPRGIASDWRPYYHGRWTWLHMCGWTWIPYEPWGWSTFHYGRWHWGLGLGWYWIPTNIWGPAWVSWYRGYDYYGWAPLSYYGYPGVIINNRYYGRYSDSYYPYNSRAITVIHKNRLRTRNISRDAVGQETIRKIGKVKLSSNQLPLRPSQSQVTVKNIKGTKLLYRKGDPVLVEPMGGKQVQKLSRQEVKKPPSADVKKTSKKAAGKSKTTEKRKIVKKKSEVQNQIKGNVPDYKSRGYIKNDSYGYPPSPQISREKYSRNIKTRKSSSFLGRVYKYISGDSKYIRSGSSRSSSQGSSSKAVRRSPSSSRSSRATSSRRSSPSRSSSSSSRSSGKIRKKK